MKAEQQRHGQNGLSSAVGRDQVKRCTCCDGGYAIVARSVPGYISSHLSLDTVDLGLNAIAAQGDARRPAVPCFSVPFQETSELRRDHMGLRPWIVPTRDALIPVHVELVPVHALSRRNESW